MKKLAIAFAFLAASLGHAHALEVGEIFQLDPNRPPSTPRTCDTLEKLRSNTPGCGAPASGQNFKVVEKSDDAACFRDAKSDGGRCYWAVVVPSTVMPGVDYDAREKAKRDELAARQQAARQETANDNYKLPKCGSDQAKETLARVVRTSVNDLLEVYTTDSNAKQRWCYAYFIAPYPGLGGSFREAVYTIEWIDEASGRYWLQIRTEQRTMPNPSIICSRLPSHPACRQGGIPSGTAVAVALLTPPPTQACSWARTLATEYPSTSRWRPIRRIAST